MWNAGANNDIFFATPEFERVVFEKCMVRLNVLLFNNTNMSLTDDKELADSAM